MVRGDDPMGRTRDAYDAVAGDYASDNARRPMSPEILVDDPRSRASGHTPFGSDVVVLVPELMHEATG